jgi:hypothetical protein
MYATPYRLAMEKLDLAPDSVACTTDIILISQLTPSQPFPSIVTDTNSIQPAAPYQGNPYIQSGEA